MFRSRKKFIIARYFYIRFGNTVSHHCRRQYKYAGSELKQVSPQNISLSRLVSHQRLEGVTKPDHTLKLSNCLLPKSQILFNFTSSLNGKNSIWVVMSKKRYFQLPYLRYSTGWIDKMVVKFTKIQFFSYGMKKIKRGPGIYY